MALFSKRHYEAIARIVRQLPAGPVRRETALLFATALHEDNPRFNEEKFYSAIGAFQEHGSEKSHRRGAMGILEDYEGCDSGIDTTWRPAVGNKYCSKCTSAWPEDCAKTCPYGQDGVLRKE